MRDQLIQYINQLFAGAADSDDIRQEILQNTLDRYDDLIAQGKSEDEAYQQTILSIGDIHEILGNKANVQLVPTQQRSLPGQVCKLSLDWRSGDISIQAADVPEMQLDQYGGDKPMEVEQEDDSLSITHPYAGFPGLLRKVPKIDVNILVPRNWKLAELEVNSDSSPLKVEGLAIDKMDVDTSSGGTVCINCGMRKVEINKASGNSRFENCAMDSLDVDSASGGVTCVNCSVKSADINQASGKTEFENCAVDSLEIDSASGSAQFSGSLNTLDFDSASGSFTGRLSNCPRKIEMDAMSGKLDLTLPADSGFTLTMDGLSKHFRSDFPIMVRDGKQICGDGRCRIDVDGMSCAVQIHKS